MSTVDLSDTDVYLFWGIKIPKEFLENYAWKYYLECEDEPLEHTEETIKTLQIHGYEPLDLSYQLGQEFMVSNSDHYIVVGDSESVFYSKTDGRGILHERSFSKELENVNNLQLEKVKKFCKDNIPGVTDFTPRPVCIAYEIPK